VALYKFLTTSKVDPWLEHNLCDKKRWENAIFKEVYHTCIEVSAWYRTNKQSLEDRTVLEIPETSTLSLLTWCEQLPGPQCVADRLWRRACHVWFWNTWTSCIAVTYGYEWLVQLDIWANHPDILVPNDEATQLLKDEEQVLEDNEKNTRGYKSSGNLGGNLNLRYANAFSDSSERTCKSRSF
jgi:hypothetical protein